MKNLVCSRKEQYKEYKEVSLPSHFTLMKGEIPGSLKVEEHEMNFLKGSPCTSGVVSGKVSIFKEFSIPNDSRVDILVAQHTDPGWTPLIGLCKGMIIEHGGILSHAAIVSRELGIPTVIGVERATEVLRDDQIVEVNGDTGTIRFLS